MKKSDVRRIIILCLWSVVLSILMMSCRKMEDGECVLVLSFVQDDGYSVSVKSDNMPDTNSFILTIKTVQGDTVYDGYYGERPDKITLPSLQCVISVVSRRFSSPEFDAPQYGDSQEVTGTAGGVLSVKLECRQLNAGVRVCYSDEFKAFFSDASFSFRYDSWVVGYPFDEDRILFFPPGKVQMFFVEDGNERVIMVKDIKAAQVLTVNLSISGSIGESGVSIKIGLDTSRTWDYIDYVFGEENDGSSKEKALTVAQAKEWAGIKNVWVKGYIVGWDVRSGVVTFTGGVNNASHIAISHRSVEDISANCFGVELASGTDIRQALNLVDNKDILHRLVYLKGNLDGKYLGLGGIKSLKEYSFE